MFRVCEVSNWEDAEIWKWTVASDVLNTTKNKAKTQIISHFSYFTDENLSALSEDMRSERQTALTSTAPPQGTRGEAVTLTRRPLLHSIWASKPRRQIFWAAGT